MKEFKTLTEVQILKGAWMYYLEKMLLEKERFGRMPESDYAHKRYEDAKAKERELHDELLRLESEKQ